MNPWLDLPTSPPFIARADAAIIDAHNAGAAPEYVFHTDVIPEPYIGDPAAPLLLLNGNPGYTPGDEASYRNPGEAETMLRNLRHEPLAMPFYLLDRGNSPGHLWWRDRLGALVRLYGTRLVARNVFCVELSPYHSVSLATITLPSQRYSNDLVKRAVARGALPLIMRCREEWYQAIPEIHGVQHFVATNPRKPYVSAGNFPDGWARICEIMRAAEAAAALYLKS